MHPAIGFHSSTLLLFIQDTFSREQLEGQQYYSLLEVFTCLFQEAKHLGWLVSPKRVSWVPHVFFFFFNAFVGSVFHSAEYRGASGQAHSRQGVAPLDAGASPLCLDG